MIDEFLARRSTSHLVLVVTTRSVGKSAETTRWLQRHLHQAAARPKHSSSSYDPEDAIRRVHILSVQLDLCNLPSVYAAADQLVNGTVSSSPASDDEPDAPLSGVRIPRLDAVIFNAGIGGWLGVNWAKCIWQFLTKGMIQVATWPSFKEAKAGQIIDPMSGKTPTRKDEDRLTAPVMGKVFGSNVFGHWLFAHQLLPLLTRPAGSALSPARIIWTGSVDTAAADFSPDDFQATKTLAPYESTKRLTDILALTADLPSVRPISAPYFRLPDGESRQGAIQPRFYLSHPGVVASTLFPLNFVFFYLFKLLLYIVRWLGSPWHPVTSYLGAAAPVWIALQSQDELDALHAERSKWGSAADWMARSAVKRTEVENWGWEGKVEDREELARDRATWILRKRVGRKAGVRDCTEETLEEFEALGAECWKEMEKLRHQWEMKMATTQDGEGLTKGEEV